MNEKYEEKVGKTDHSTKQRCFVPNARQRCSTQIRSPFSQGTRRLAYRSNIQHMCIHSRNTTMDNSGLKTSFPFFASSRQHTEAHVAHPIASTIVDDASQTGNGCCAETSSMCLYNDIRDDAFGDDEHVSRHLTDHGHDGPVSTHQGRERQPGVYNVCCYHPVGY